MRSVPGSRSASRWIWMLTVLSCCSPVFAQRQNYSRSVPIFPNVFQPYASRAVPEPNLSNSGRVGPLLRDGKLMLSLNDAIALALENNLDLVIARYNLPIADTDILRTQSGAALRGVNTGLIQGTPGGGAGAIGNTGAAGGGAGGTSAAAGGAGSGIGGIVASTLGVGPPIDSFDPILTSSFGLQYTNTPQSNIVFTGVPALQQNTGYANFNYAQGFPTGTLVSLTFNNNRATSNSVRTSLVPQLNTNYLVQVRQHLLQGLGFAPNKRFILIARNNREIVDVAFRQQVIFTVTQIENLYWNLVSASEDVTAKERALKLAQQLEDNNRRQVEAGTMAPIEVINAQAQVAASQQDLIIAQTNLALQQSLMKNAITKHENDPTLASAEVVPTDRMQLPANEPVVPIQELIQEALGKRPELAQARIDLTNRGLSKQSAHNNLLPALDLVANYGGAALAGQLNPNFVGAPPTVPLGGWTDAVGLLNNHATYFVGLTLTVPIKNRAAQADQVRSVLEYQQAEVRLQELQNGIAIDVRNAQYAVVQNRARVEAALKGREYAAQSLDAEQKKLAEGIGTTFSVLQALTNLGTAESNLVGAMTAYEQSHVQLDVVTGRTLDNLGISMGDAQSGTVTRLPQVPGVVPSDQAGEHPIAPGGQP
jgi:outer membrane protein TolC